MLIDFHAHTFPEKIAKKTIEALEERADTKATREGTVEALLLQMEETGVDLSVVLPVVTNPKQFQSVNEYAAMLNETHAGKLLSFGGIHPDCADYMAELSYIKELGLKGIKIHPDYQGYFIDDLKYLRIIHRATELGLAIVTHAGVDIGLPSPVHCPPDRARHMLDEVKPEKMVLAHTGGWKQWDQVEEFLVGQKVFFDIAFTSRYLEKNQFEQMVRRHGIEQILFATDTPWESPKETVAYVESTELTVEEKEKIYSKNAKKILR